MPALGLNSTWGADEWAAYVLERLSTQSSLLRAGARLIPVVGRTASIPRVLTDGQATWTAEGAEITSNAPTGDVIQLVPKKLGNVVTLTSESLEDAPVSELDAVGDALTRSVATAIDARAFSNTAASATAPAGLLTYGLQALAGAVTIDNIIRAIGVVEEVGGTANAAFVNPGDLTDLRLVKDAAGSNRPVLEPDLQTAGAVSIGGARLFSTPALPAGTAIVGDAAQIVVGVRRDIRVEFSGDAKFTADSVAAKVTARVDWEPNDVRGLVVVKDS